MSKHEKLLKRFLQQPADFSWDELARLLAKFGYRLDNKGKTSGSRVRFIHTGAPPIDLHKPHPGNILKRYQLHYLQEFLQREGFLAEANHESDEL